jgi:hypothetical protein
MGGSGDCGLPCRFPCSPAAQLPPRHDYVQFTDHGERAIRRQIVVTPRGTLVDVFDMCPGSGRQPSPNPCTCPLLASDSHPGLSIGMVHNDQLVFARGYGFRRALPAHCIDR